MIPIGIIFDIGREQRFYLLEKKDLLSLMEKTVPSRLFTYLSPTIQAGFETGFYPFHFSTVRDAMGMESSLQLLVIFLVFR
jgi:hypothetical protein